MRLDYDSCMVGVSECVGCVNGVCIGQYFMFMWNDWCMHSPCDRWSRVVIPVDSGVVGCANGMCYVQDFMFVWSECVALAT